MSCNSAPKNAEVQPFLAPRLINAEWNAIDSCPMSFIQAEPIDNRLAQGLQFSDFICRIE